MNDKNRRDIARHSKSCQPDKLSNEGVAALAEHHLYRADKPQDPLRSDRDSSREVKTHERGFDPGVIDSGVVSIG